MAKISILITLLHLFCTMIHGTFLCSEYFTYMTKPEEINLLGQIKIPSPPENEDFFLRIALNTINEVPPQKDRFVRLELAQSIEESIRAVQQDNFLLYYVYFPSDEPIPSLSAIWFNNQKYCPTSGNITATIELGHIVPYYLTNKKSFSQNSSLNSLHRNYRKYRKYYIKSPTHHRLKINQIYFKNVPTTVVSPNENDNIVFLETFQFNNDSNANNNECGISNRTGQTINILISNGQKTLPGQWPWLVALFIVKTVYEFQCAGTILTNRHILTAGHCLKLRFTSNDTISSNVLMVVLGQFKLYQWDEAGIVNREVASYKIHPDYAHVTTGDSDLAILVLKTPVEYNFFIRPICLWSGSAALQNIVGKTGYVVGWGEDELGHSYTKEPRMARVPIVNHEDCHWSHPIFVILTSNRTFCAGLRYGSNPCNGDSGSGLVLYDNTTGRYQLRGVVSRSVIGNESLCDPTKYVVYVDVAKYVPWIQQQISIT